MGMTPDEFEYIGGSIIFFGSIATMHLKSREARALPKAGAAAAPGYTKEIEEVHPKSEIEMVESEDPIDMASIYSNPLKEPDQTHI